MSTLRRILTVSALAAIAVGMASANTITYGFDSSTGKYTVTQTASVGPTNLNVVSPTSTFTFLDFASLGIAGATYITGDSTFDYEFTNSVNVFNVTNNDSGTDTFNASVQSLVNVDSSSTMPNGYSSLGDQRNADLGLGFTDPFISPTPNQQTVTAASTPGGGETLGSAQTWNYSPLPVVTTIGIGYDQCGTFGSLNTHCSLGLTADGTYSGSGSYTYGLTDTQQFADSLVGTGNLNLTFVATTTYTGEAEVTYEYSVPVNGSPEPATMLLFGSALVGLGCIRKRIRKS